MRPHVDIMQLDSMNDAHVRHCQLQGESLPLWGTVGQIMDQLTAAGVGQRPTVFVCHRCSCQCKMSRVSHRTDAKAFLFAILAC